MSEVIHITNNEDFKSEVLNYKGVVVLDFRAEWCGPCRMVGPEMEKLAVDNEGKNVKIAKVNVEENPDLSSSFEIASIPAVFFLKDGKPVDKIIGANPKNVYQAKIDELLKS